MTDIHARLRITGESAGAVTAANDAGKAVQSMGSKAGSAKRQVDDVGRSARDFERNARGAQNAALALGGALGGIGAVQLAREITDAAFAVKGFEVGLGAVAGGAAGARAEMAFVREEAERLGLNLQTASQRFLSLAGATNGTTLAGQQTREIFLGVSEAGLAMGRSTEQVQRGLEAISQIASKGVVSMEEVRQQLAEAIPGAVNIAARAMGVSTTELNKMVESGNLLATDFVPKFAAQLREEFGPAVEQFLGSDLGQARVELGKLQTALFDLSAVSGEDFLAGFVDGLSSLNGSLTDAETVEQVRRLARALGELAGAGAEGLGFLAEHLDEVVTILGVFMGMRAGAALAELGAKAATAARDVGLLRAALSLLGGPVSIAIGVGVGALTALALASEAAEEKVRAGASAIRDNSAALDETNQLLADAGVQSRLFGAESGGAIEGTNGLAGATRNLADQTYRLADARAQAAMKSLETADTKLAAEQQRVWDRLRDADRSAPGWVQLWGTERQKAMVRSAATIQAEIGTKADGTPLMGFVNAEAYERRISKERLENLSARMALLNAPPVKPLELGNGGGGGGASESKGSGKSDRAGRMAADLQADVVALAGHREALKAGGEALDAWRVAEAGRQAVEQSGLANRGKATAAESGLAAQIRAAAEEAERLKIAGERVEAAIGIQKSARADTDALKRRSEAAMAGEQALEDLRIVEAGLDAQRALGIDTLNQLAGADRAEAEAAIDAAMAKERQAIATEKAERVAGTVRDIDQRIAAEQRRAAAIRGGIDAEVAYARAEFERQYIERAGTNLTAEQIALLREKARVLFELGAANDEADFAKHEAEELRLLQMTNREREVEIRYLRILTDLKKKGVDLSEEELKARAQASALVEQGAADDAEAIGRLKNNLRDAFIETGKLSFDDVGDYVEKRLREAVYDALLAEPIDIVIRAIVGQVSGLTSALGGGGSGGGLLGSLVGGGGSGGSGSGGLIGSLLGKNIPGIGATIGSVLGSAGIGSIIAPMLGIRGSGNGLVDGAASLGGAALGSWAGGMAASTAAFAAYTTATAGAAGAAAAGAVGPAMAGFLGTLAPMLGPIGAIAGLLIAGLGRDDQRPYARSDIGVVDGRFTVTGGQELDQGPLDQTNEAAQRIAESLNGAAELFGLDMSKLGGLLTSVGYVEGKNTGALGQGWFGGQGGGFAGAEFTGSKDPEALAAEVVRATILHAIEMGASDLSEAEQRVFREASTLEEAANKIQTGRSLATSIDDAILQLTNPAEFERKKALDAIEANYQALKAQAEEMIAAGLVSGDVLLKLDQLKNLQVSEALVNLANAANGAAAALSAGARFALSIQDRILQLTDPNAFKLKQIEDDIAAKRKTAEELIAAGDADESLLLLIDQLRAAEIAAAMGSFSSSVGDATSAVQDMTASLKQWLLNLKTSPSAELSPAERRKAALEAYEKALASGDTANITRLADQLLAADREATASAQDRLALYERIVREIEKLAGVSSDAKVDTLTSVTRMQAAAPTPNLDLARIGMTSAQANLTPANDAAPAGAQAQVLGQVVSALERVEGALRSGLGGVGEGLAGMAEAAQAQVDRAGELLDEQRVTNLKLAARAR